MGSVEKTSARQTRQSSKVIRALDILFSIVGLVAGSPLLLLLSIIGLFDTGSPIFRQVRVGQYKRPFTLVKFRTMKPGTPSVPTHLVDASATTAFGRFLRRTKLDELPQLWNVLKGDMSLVGPRPCLFDQVELIKERERRGIFEFRPGITGLAQVMGIDMSDPKLLVQVEQQMLSSLTVRNYLRYIVLTVLGSGRGDRVRYHSEVRG